MAEASERWDRYRIKAEVWRRGSSLTEVALNAGISESSCRVALSGNSRSGAEALSRFLDVPLSDLFPGLYLRSRPTRQKPTATPASPSRQKRKPAADTARARA